MKKGKLGAALLCVLLLLEALVPTAAAAPYMQNGWVESETTRTAAVMMLSQEDGFHTGYMDGDSRGMFRPEEALTRVELAQMLYGITADRPSFSPVLYDVPGDAWYAPAVETAAGLGLMTSDGGFFRPGDPATRAECAYALSQLLPYDAPLLDIFPDVWPGHWAYQAICRTTAWGLFQGDGQGGFRPNDVLRRCEAAAVFNRLLGRSPDLEAARTGLQVFSDVPRSHWAYSEIMEAAVAHQCVSFGDGGERWLSLADEVPAVPAVQPTDAAGLSDGPQRIDGHLYWVVDEKFVRSCNMSGLYFDENGWYTTGDGELDGLLNGIVDQLTDESMTRDKKLRVLFDYVVTNYKYLARPLVSKSATGWEPEYALFFLKNGKGNCFSFAAAYCLLCRELGLLSYTVVGTSGGSPHGWVEIPLDGSTYMFDPELQWYYNNRTKKNYNLFKMLPSKIPAGVYRYAW